MSLTIVESFGKVDQVRWPQISRRRFGVPIGGPFDRESFLLANAMLGGIDEFPTFELGMADVRFRATAEGTIAVVGPDSRIWVRGTIHVGSRTLRVRFGDEIHIEPSIMGARVYVAFQPQMSASEIRLAKLPSSLDTRKVRFTSGPQFDQLNLLPFSQAPFKVARECDRSGIRLLGPNTPHSFHLPSEPACVGAIQITNAGQPIIIGPDGPTVGGYPKIGVVIDADIDYLAQLRPTDPVEFSQVPINEARQFRGEWNSRISRQTAQLRLAYAAER